jgi:hypothetical protein
MVFLINAMWLKNVRSCGSPHAFLHWFVVGKLTRKELQFLKKNPSSHAHK